MPLSHQLDAFLATGVAGPLGDDRLAIGPMKFYADGALSGEHGLLPAPRTGRHEEFAGSSTRSQKNSARSSRGLERNGWQVGVHAQGDRAIEHVLDASIAPGDLRGRATRGTGIEHCRVSRRRQLQRIADLGVIAVCQPGYLYDFGDDVPHRARRAGAPAAAAAGSARSSGSRSC